MREDMSAAPEHVTVKEAAHLLRVRQERVRIYVREGALRAARLPGGHIRVKRADVEALLSPSEEGKEEDGVTATAEPEPAK